MPKNLRFVDTQNRVPAYARRGFAQRPFMR